MDNKGLTLEDVKEALHNDNRAHEKLKREVDSLDDFEHLEHDISPMKEAGARLEHAARDASQNLINTNVGSAAISAANRVIDDELLAFDPLPPPPPKMDSNLLEIGDSFPDRKAADDKLDKFFAEMSTYSPPKPQDAAEEPPKTALDMFMAAERGGDQLERYSDSDDDFRPSKYDDIPKQVELPESFGSTDNFKSEAFKDVEDFKQEPRLPVKDYPPAPLVPEVVTSKSVPAMDKPPEIKSETTTKKEHVPEAIVRPTAPPPAEPPVPRVQICPIKPVGELKSKSEKVVTDAEAIFCKMGLDTWFNPERLNPKVESLIYWRDPKKSGPVFGGVLLILLSLTYFSLISVVAYLSLFILTATICFRIYKNILQAVQKTGEGHPFKELLEFDVSLPQDKVKEITEIAIAHFNAGVVELRRLFLVEDLVDSIKFGVLLWTLTYLGAWFNGMTLIIIAWVALFTLPKVYETNKTQIDANLEIVRTKLAEITSKVKAAIPIGKKVEVEKKEQ